MAMIVGLDGCNLRREVLSMVILLVYLQNPWSAFATVSAELKETDELRGEFVEGNSKVVSNKRAVVNLQTERFSVRNCVPQNKQMRRLENTRFYVIQGEDEDDFESWESAKKLCELHGLKIAQIDKISSLSSLGRLFNKITTEQFLRDTWYILNSKRDGRMYEYMWRDDPQPLKFSNQLYRKPSANRINIAEIINAAENKTDPEHETHGHFRKKTKSYKEQCMTIALPIHGVEKATGLAQSTTFDARFCGSIAKRHAICESPDTSCNGDHSKIDHFVLSENEIKENYFTKGNWIVGDRKYIVNFEQRDKQRSLEYCEKLGLQLLDPGTGDACLISFMKLWARNVTINQFWSTWKYIVTTREIKTATGLIVSDGKARKMENEANNGTTTTKKFKKVNENEFCLSLSHYYDFKLRVPCPFSETDLVTLCNWNSISYVPANCKTTHGVVCQHQNHLSRNCNWKRTFWNNVTSALIETATTTFGWSKNLNTFRSTYKQTFGSLLCPDGYRMTRSNNENWFSSHSHGHGDGSQNEVYQYDYLESYWVVDDELFRKNKSSLCTISAPDSEDGKSRALKRVSCLEWHFYLCEKISLPVNGRRYALNKPNYEWQWNNKPTPRYYPIIK